MCSVLPLIFRQRLVGLFRGRGLDRLGRGEYTGARVKRALIPIVLILLAIAALAALSYLYENKWGIDGPFPDEHHHHD